MNRFLRVRFLALLAGAKAVPAQYAPMVHPWMRPIFHPWGNLAATPTRHALLPSQGAQGDEGPVLPHAVSLLASAKPEAVSASTDPLKPINPDGMAAPADETSSAPSSGAAAANQSDAPPTDTTCGAG